MLVLGVAFAFVVACDAPAATTAKPPAASLSRSDAEKLMLQADDARRRALASPGAVTLSDAFGRSALQRLEAQSQTLAGRGMREEERSSSREVVFWDPGADEAVLQVVAERRLVTRDQPMPAWSSTIRQWWARLQNVDGSWKVVDQEDLPPDRWR